MSNFISNLLSLIYRMYYRSFGVVIGKNVMLRNHVNLLRGFSHIKKGNIIIEEKCELCQGVVLKAYGGLIRIRPNTFLGEYVVIYGHGDVEIGENTLIAMHTCIVSANHTVPGRSELIRSKDDILLPVKIGSDVWIGAGVKVLGGVTIGDGCVIGAGALVNKDLPPYSIAVGVPAHITGYRNE